MLNTYRLKNTLLETVKTTKYLGIEISNNLNWTPHIEKVTQKANRNLGLLRRNIRTTNTTVKTKWSRKFCQKLQVKGTGQYVLRLTKRTIK